MRSSRSIIVVSFDCDNAAYAAAAAAATSGPEGGGSDPVRVVDMFVIVVCIVVPFGGRMFPLRETGGPSILAVDVAGIEVMFSWGASGNQFRDFVAGTVGALKPGGGDSDFCSAGNSKKFSFTWSTAVAINSITRNL